MMTFCGQALISYPCQRTSGSHRLWCSSGYSNEAKEKTDVVVELVNVEDEIAPMVEQPFRKMSEEEVVSIETKRQLVEEEERLGDLPAGRSTGPICQP